jgi:hypothetical protein
MLNKNRVHSGRVPLRWEFVWRTLEGEMLVAHASGRRPALSVSIHKDQREARAKIRGLERE